VVGSCLTFVIFPLRGVQGCKFHPQA